MDSIKTTHFLETVWELKTPSDCIIYFLKNAQPHFDFI